MPIYNLICKRATDKRATVMLFSFFDTGRCYKSPCMHRVSLSFLVNRPRCLHLGNKGEKQMRKPKIENKYNIRPDDLNKADVIDRDRITRAPF